MRWRPRRFRPLWPGVKQRLGSLDSHKVQGQAAPRLSVAVDMTFPNRNRGGTGVYARSLVEALRNLAEIEVRELAGPATSNLTRTLGWLLAGAGRELSHPPPDLLHCPSYVVPWGVRVPLVVTVHDAAARQFPADHPLEWRLYDRVILPRRLRAASRIITVSKSARRDIVDAYGVPDARIVVIPNGVDARFFKAPRVETSDHPVMLFPGAPLPRKNIDVVLRAMAAAGPETRLGRARLEVSGARPDDFQNVVSRIGQLGLRDRVSWLGYVPPEDMPALVAGASVVVYPSLAEGFGLPVLEAFAAGTPTVSSNRGSLPEIVGDAGLLVDPTDADAMRKALDAVLENGDLRMRLRDLGLKRVQQYTWRRCAEMTCEVYREVTAEEGARR